MTSLPSSLTRALALTLAAAAACLTCLACEEKQTTPKQESSKGDAGAPRSSSVDKNIQEAVAAVAAGVGAPEQGPPQTGVFAPGAADKEIRAGDPPKLTVGGKGSGPTILIAPSAPKSGKKLDGRAQVAVQTGPRSAMPTADLSLVLETTVPKSDMPDAPPGAPEVIVRVSAAKLAKEQPGELPPELGAQIAKMKGSRVKFVLANGAGRFAGLEPSKELDPSLVPIVGSASDALALAFLPYPSEPVGEGAFWMITSREVFAGLDVVAYRMVKLLKVEADRATLGIETKRYMAGGQLAFPGIPPHRIEEFNGNTSAQLVVAVSDSSVVRGQVTDVILANLTPQGGGPQGQKMQVHLEVRTQLAVGGGG